VWCIETSEPDAAQPTWSKPRRIGDGVMMCKPLALSSGEWALPISKWKEHDNSAQMIVSNDQGKTWTRRGGVAFPRTDFDEHMIVERQDGSLWMLARTKDGISESVSTNKGATWSEPQPSSIQKMPPKTGLKNWRWEPARACWEPARACWEPTPGVSDREKNARKPK
jgi:hypothetical protein